MAQKQVAEARASAALWERQRQASARSVAGEQSRCAPRQEASLIRQPHASHARGPEPTAVSWSADIKALREEVEHVRSAAAAEAELAEDKISQLECTNAA